MFRQKNPPPMSVERKKSYLQSNNSNKIVSKTVSSDVQPCHTGCPSPWLPPPLYWHLKGKDGIPTIALHRGQLTDLIHGVSREQDKGPACL